MKPGSKTSKTQRVAINKILEGEKQVILNNHIFTVVSESVLETGSINMKVLEEYSTQKGIKKRTFNIVNSYNRLTTRV